MRSKVDQQLGALAAVLSRRYRTEVDFLDSVHLRKAHDKGKLAKKIDPVALKKLDKISDEVFKKHNYLALSECVASTICGDIGFITYDFISSEDSLITEIESEVESEPINIFKITDGDYQFAEIKEFEGNEMIIQALYNWESIKKKINLKTKKLQQKHTEAFIKYLQGHPCSKIAEMFNVTDGALTNGYNNSGWMAIVRTELIGHLVEYQLTQQGEHYAEYKRIAGNARIDLLSPDKRKAVEVKVREQRETPTANMLSAEMLKLLGEGFHCELCYCILRFGKAVFKTYQITQTTQQLYDLPTPQEKVLCPACGKVMYTDDDHYYRCKYCPTTFIPDGSRLLKELQEEEEGGS